MSDNTNSDRPITRCPQCGTMFRVSIAQLQAASGVVRCGGCLNTFEALDFLVSPNLLRPLPPPLNPKPVTEKASDLNQAGLELSSQNENDVEAETVPTNNQNFDNEDSDDDWLEKLDKDLDSSLLEKNENLDDETLQTSIQNALSDLNDTAQPEQVDELKLSKEPEQVNELEQSEEPEKVGELKQSEEPEQVDELGQSEKPEQVDEFEQSEKPEQVDEFEQSEEPEQVNELEQSEEPEQVDELEQVEEPEQVDELKETDEIPDVENALDIQAIEKEVSEIYQNSSDNAFDTKKPENSEEIEDPSYQSSESFQTDSHQLPNSEADFNAFLNADIPDVLSDPLFSTEETSAPPPEASEEFFENTEKTSKSTISDEEVTTTELLVGEDVSNNLLEQEAEDDYQEMADLLSSHNKNRIMLNRKLLLIALLLSPLIAIQFIYFRWDSWTNTPEHRNWMNKVCYVLSCQLPPLTALDKIEILKQALLKKPQSSDQWQFDLLVQNLAEFSQPYPKLHLRLNGVAGEILAETLIDKENYLSKGFHNSLMPSGKPIHIAIVLKLDVANFSGYEINFVHEPLTKTP